MILLLTSWKFKTLIPLIIILTCQPEVAECQETTESGVLGITNHQSTQEEVTHQEWFELRRSYANCTRLRIALKEEKPCRDIKIMAEVYSDFRCILNPEEDEPRFCSGIKRCPDAQDALEVVYTFGTQVVINFDDGNIMLAEIGNMTCPYDSSSKAIEESWSLVFAIAVVNCLMNVLNQILFY